MAAHLLLTECPGLDLWQRSATQAVCSCVSLSSSFLPTLLSSGRVWAPLTLAMLAFDLPLDFGF